MLVWEPRLSAFSVSSPKKRSTRFSQEASRESFSASNLCEREFRAKYQKADDSALLLSVIWPNLEGEYYLM